MEIFMGMRHRRRHRWRHGLSLLGLIRGLFRHRFRWRYGQRRKISTMPPPQKVSKRE